MDLLGSLTNAGNVTLFVVIILGFITLKRAVYSRARRSQ